MTATVTFTVGQPVILLGPKTIFPSEFRGWDDSWKNNIIASRGKVFKVESNEIRGGVSGCFTSGGSPGWIPSEWLRPIKEGDQFRLISHYHSFLINEIYTLCQVSEVSDGLVDHGLVGYGLFRSNKNIRFSCLIPRNELTWDDWLSLQATGVFVFVEVEEGMDAAKATKDAPKNHDITDVISMHIKVNNVRYGDLVAQEALLQKNLEEVREKLVYLRQTCLERGVSVDSDMMFHEQEFKVYKVLETMQNTESKSEAAKTIVKLLGLK